MLSSLELMLRKMDSTFETIRAYKEVKLHGSTIEPGTTLNGVTCPFCNGGRNSEKSMSITRRRDGVILYICHRASCGRSGRINLEGHSNTNETTTTKEFKPRVYEGRTRSVETDDLISVGWWLTPEDAKTFQLTIEEGNIPRLIIPIRDFKGTKIGTVSRRMWPGDLRPKTLSYKEKDVPWLGWFMQPKYPEVKGLYTGPVLVVEDCISAMRASGYVPTVALMGCNLPLNDLMEILKITDNIFLALDRDATEKAYKFKEKYSFIAPNLQVIPLEQDLKELPSHKIHEKLERYIYDEYDSQ